MLKTESQARDSDVQVTKEGHCSGHHGRAGKRTIQTQTQTQTDPDRGNNMGETVAETDREAETETEAEAETETETETEAEAQGKLKKKTLISKNVQKIRFLLHLSRSSRCGVDPSVVICARVVKACD